MTPEIFKIRRMEERDLEAVGHIQTATPEASHWPPADYLAYDSFVAAAGGRIAGFAVARRLPPDEIEILNVAVDPGLRRQGVGRALLRALLALPGRSVFLEVRASNAAAQALYAGAGFTLNGRRRNYYPPLGDASGPREDAVVMKMQK